VLILAIKEEKPKLQALKYFREFTGWGSEIASSLYVLAGGIHGGDGGSRGAVPVRYKSAPDGACQKLKKGAKS
jgi:hypothetical protein